jgi:hypothetical protein
MVKHRDHSTEQSEQVSSKQAILNFRRSSLAEYGKLFELYNLKMF